MPPLASIVHSSKGMASWHWDPVKHAKQVQASIAYWIPLLLQASRLRSTCMYRNSLPLACQRLVYESVRRLRRQAVLQSLQIQRTGRVAQRGLTGMGNTAFSRAAFAAVRFTSLLRSVTVPVVACCWYTTCTRAAESKQHTTAKTATRQLRKTNRNLDTPAFLWSVEQRVSQGKYYRNRVVPVTVEMPTTKVRKTTCVRRLELLGGHLRSAGCFQA